MLVMAQALIGWGCCQQQQGPECAARQEPNTSTFSVAAAESRFKRKSSECVPSKCTRAAAIDYFSY